MRSVLVLFAISLAFAQKPKEEGGPAVLPPAEARALVLESCTTCHSTRVIADARLSREAWAKDINDMIQRGAQVFPEEIGPITDYLSKAFGPGVPKPLNVNTATREDLEKLPGMKPELAARIVDVRAKASSFRSPEELRRALGMEKAEFEQVLYLLKYRD